MKKRYREIIRLFDIKGSGTKEDPLIIPDAYWEFPDTTYWAKFKCAECGKEDVKFHRTNDVQEWIPLCHYCSASKRLRKNQ